MEQFILHGGVHSWEKYSCAAMSSEQWTNRTGVRHEIEGLLMTAFGIIVELMYVPCLWVLSKKEFQAHSCFKIMLILGFVDVGAILINSIISGLLLYQGAVFCTYPTFIYISGCFGLGLWCMSCTLCLLLVINRLFDLARTDLGKRIFDGKKTYVYCLFPILYGSYFFFFTNTMVFNSKYSAWFFDPMIKPGVADEYNSFSHFANNVLVVSCTVFLYGYFVIFLGKKVKNDLSWTSNNGAVRAHRQIFVQSAIICTFTFTASIIYVFFQLTEVPLWLIQMGHVFWEIAHSCPAFLYLFVNKTIRQSVINEFRLRRFQRVLAKSIPSSADPTVYRMGQAAAVMDVNRI